LRFLLEKIYNSLATKTEEHVSECYGDSGKMLPQIGVVRRLDLEGYLGLHFVERLVLEFRIVNFAVGDAMEKTFRMIVYDLINCGVV
jgi:hypothetical protein